jgi:hypothetical protein
MNLRLAAVALFTILLVAATATGKSVNGFELKPSSVPLHEILRGAPRDRIPALDHPITLAADSASATVWSDGERVVGVVVAGEARAYPIAILTWHELVNDDLGGRPILVSYCPLCGTAMVFDRSVGGRVERFGVSGLLYQSDLLMFDRRGESLWSQISATAVTGPSLGQRLGLIRSRVMRWGDWKRAHPSTTILSPRTGHARDYDVSPYADYERSNSLFFPARKDRRYHLKEPTLGLRVPGGAARAYPAKEIRSAGGRVEEEFAGARVSIAWDPAREQFTAEAPSPIEVVEGFWFAWAAFHPNTTVFRASAAR